MKNKKSSLIILKNGGKKETMDGNYQFNLPDIIIPTILLKESIEVNILIILRTKNKIFTIRIKEG